jgi:hypothetical protein
LEPLGFGRKVHIVINSAEEMRAWVQEAIDQGATTVEEIHKRIAALPLSTLKSIPGLDPLADTAEDLTHKSIGAVYEAIRTVNAQVSEIARQLLDQVPGAR